MISSVLTAYGHGDTGSEKGSPTMKEGSPSGPKKCRTTASRTSKLDTSSIITSLIESMMSGLSLSNIGSLGYVLRWSETATPSIWLEPLSYTQLYRTNEKP